MLRPAMRRLTLLLAGLAGLSLSAAGCGGPSSQYCAAASRCDEEVRIIPIIGDLIPVDGVGNSDDSVGVCAAEIDGYLAGLRANSEEVCQELADAYVAFMDCAIQEDSCDAWTDSECQDEREEIFDLWQDADNRCDE